MGYMCLFNPGSSEYMPRSGIAGSYGGFIPCFFKEPPDNHPVIHSDCVSLHSHQ